MVNRTSGNITTLGRYAILSISNLLFYMVYRMSIILDQLSYYHVSFDSDDYYFDHYVELSTTNVFDLAFSRDFVFQFDEDESDNMFGKCQKMSNALRRIALQSYCDKKYTASHLSYDMFTIRRLLNKFTVMLISNTDCCGWTSLFKVSPEFQHLYFRVKNLVYRYYRYDPSSLILYFNYLVYTVYVKKDWGVKFLIDYDLCNYNFYDYSIIVRQLRRIFGYHVTKKILKFLIDDVYVLSVVRDSD